MKHIFYLVLWLHTVGCGFWLVVDINADTIRVRPTDKEVISMKWYPPLNWVNYVDIELYEESFGLFNKYITMYYNAVLILGVNELGPVNEIEVLYVSVTIILSVFILTLMFSDIAN